MAPAHSTTGGRITKLHAGSRAKDPGLDDVAPRHGSADFGNSLAPQGSEDASFRTSEEGWRLSARCSLSPPSQSSERSQSLPPAPACWKDFQETSTCPQKSALRSENARSTAAPRSTSKIDGPELPGPGGPGPGDRAPVTGAWAPPASPVSSSRRSSSGAVPHVLQRNVTATALSGNRWSGPRSEKLCLRRPPARAPVAPMAGHGGNPKSGTCKQTTQRHSCTELMERKRSSLEDRRY